MRSKNVMKLLVFVIFMLCSCKSTSKDDTTYISPYESEDYEQNMYVSEDAESDEEGMDDNYSERESEQIGYDDNRVIRFEDEYTSLSPIEEVIEEVFFDEDDPSRTEQYYQGLLEQFCQQYYEESFPGRVYVEGSLNVDNVSKKDIHTVKVQGTHSFKGRKWLGGLLDVRIPYPDKKFEAFIRSDGNNKYHVNFSRSQQLLIHDQINSQDVPFTYNPYE